MEEFIKKIDDLYKRSINKNIITYTGFLTPAERQIIIKNFLNVKIFFSGGVESSERTRAFFLPEYADEVNVEEYIVAFRASFSFKELSHRDFLGALLSLGIDRKCIGDIFVLEKEAYFFVSSDIAKYIKVNLDKVGSVGIKIEEVNFTDVKVLEPSFREIDFTVSSLRLDSVVAGAIKTSREKTSLFIKNGNVLLNYLVCENVSKLINEGDIFSVKGYGKFILKEVGNVSRKGKIFVKVNKYAW